MRGIALLALVGCLPQRVPPSAACPAPQDGPQLREEALVRGMDLRTFAPEDIGQERQGGHASVVAADLDADGDFDLITFATVDGLLAWENDGNAHFAARPGLLGFGDRPIVGVAAVDLDGDRLPELIRSSWGQLGYHRNLGGWRFGPPVWLLDEPDGRLIGTFHLADLDGDGDLDVIAPEQAGSKAELAGVRHRVFLQDDGFLPGLDLSPSRPIDVQALAAADCDGDGVMDVVTPGDQGPGSALFLGRGLGTDGRPVLDEVAAAVGFDLDLAAMGIDAADLNGDGYLDWVVADLGPPALLLSQGAGDFVESGAASGLRPDDFRSPFGTIGWTVDLADLDNDGDLDLLQSSARHDDPFDVPDLLFVNEGGQFTDAGAAWGVGSEAGHYGLVAADFDGDGALDVASAGMGVTPSLLMNGCSDRAWIELDFAGPRGNVEGWGAQVDLETPAGTQTQVLTNLRGQAQRPPVLHFGLGDVDEPVQATVRWPDGRVSLVEDLAPRQRHRIRLPAD